MVHNPRNKDMTKEDLKNLILDLAYTNVLRDILCQYDDPFMFIEKWVRTARPEWQDWLIELIDDSPIKDTENDLDRWNYTISNMLREWAHLLPEVILPKLGKLLSQQRVRRHTALVAFAGIQNRDTIPYLAPWAYRAAELFKEELLMLIDAIGESNSPERHDLLRIIKAQVSSKMKEVFKELALYT